MDRMHRYGDGLSTPTNLTIEQFLRDGESSGSRRSPTSLSLSPTLGREHDLNEEHIHGHNQKKSVLMKVKEKAKKLRHTLSSKKKQNEDGSSTPTWGVTLEDDDELEVEDAEYLGAPMYESELAPEGYKENARQHPRAVPVISEKHVLPSSVKQGSESPLSPNQAGVNSTSSPNNKTITDTVTEKLAPAYATVSDATHAIASKIQNLAVSATAAATSQQQRQQPGSAPAAPQMNPMQAASGSVLAPVETQSSSAPSSTRSMGTQAGKNASSVDQQIWDKGVSVKQYLMHKFEPGEDERALSQVISEAMSPRKTGGGDHVGVVEKVREAVTSLLRHDHQEPSISKSTYARSATMPPTTSRIPISTNAHEVGEEETHGRILQAN
ncbi:low-temperature-induced 65 kDa protein [Ziziphus jujuba]|uniref:Low-temperature-induced 65 kDa protein n=1 Tax=Ziziphus jujuba TaxID=326968 RepID=A0A6P3Z847_ZIZJJ|nr:low-temperature-induced 65 kDa protein [Ziziphus jujuba]